MAHTGMFVAPLAGSPPQGMSPTDGRLVMGGLFQVASQLVAGGGYSASASAMQITVNQAVWGLTDVTNAQAVFYTPTDSTTLTFSAAPATGGRIDLVVVKQNNVENGDADSRVNVTVVTGTPSGSPVAPSVPTGASMYLQVLINAGATNMQAVQVTITNAMQTIFAEPQLQAPTLTALKTTTGAASQLGSVTADTAANNGLYQWTTAGWVPVTANPHFAYARTTAFNFTTTLSTLTWDASATEGTLAGFTVASGVFTCTIAGVYLINTEATAGAAITGNIQLQKNGTAVKVNNQIGGAGNNSFVLIESLRLAVGDTIQVQIQATATVGGVADAQHTRITFDLLHV